MSNSTIAAPATSPIAVPMIAAPATVRALSSMTAMVEVASVWSTLLRRTVFPTVKIENGKVAIDHQRRLSSDKGRSVLILIWRDSSFVSDADIDEAGVDRTGTIDAPINCHNLAKRFAAGDVEELDRQEKQLKTIIFAAEAYGLIVRDHCPGKRQRPLRGTAKLHELMLAMTGTIDPILTDIYADVPGGI